MLSRGVVLKGALSSMCFVQICWICQISVEAYGEARIDAIPNTVVKMLTVYRKEKGTSESVSGSQVRYHLTKFSHKNLTCLCKRSK